MFQWSSHRKRQTLGTPEDLHYQAFDFYCTVLCKYGGFIKIGKETCHEAIINFGKFEVFDMCVPKVGELCISVHGFKIIVTIL